MTKLTLWSDIPEDSAKNITFQLVKCPESTVYDLGDITQYMEKNIPKDSFEDYQKGLEILLQVISEKYNTSTVEVKLVVSPL